jgi:NADPH:quinone reductase-like Zn-dependent oxidoreductase
MATPLEGLKYVDIPEPEARGQNQVLIGVEFSPLNQNDLLLARGIYGTRSRSVTRSSIFGIPLCVKRSQSLTGPA